MDMRNITKEYKNYSHRPTSTTRFTRVWNRVLGGKKGVVLGENFFRFLLH